VEFRLRHKDGSWRWIYARGEVVHENDGKRSRMLGCHVDITERKRAEEALRESEARFRAFVDHATDAFFLHDDRGKILDVNRQACESLGYTRAELVGMTPIDFDADVPPARFGQLSARLNAGEVMTFETRHRRKDGSTFPVEVRIRPFWQGGRRFGFSLAQDITARKRAEKLQHAVYRIAEAANSVKSLDDLFRAVHEIIQGVMPADNFYIALYDEREDILSFPYFVDEVDVSSFPQKPGKGLTEYVLRTGKSFLCDAALHEELIRREEAELSGVPSPIWLGVPLRIEDKTIGVMAVQHYTDERAYGEREKEMLEYVSSQVAKAIERKRAERALVESHSLVNAVVEGTSDAVFVKDLQGRYLMINAAGARLLGKTVEEVIGKDDGELFTPDTARAIIESDRQVMTTGGSQVLEEKATAAGVTRTYLATKSVYRDAQGQVIGLIGISRDITELKRLEEQFRQAQKMEAVGRLAGGVAHDFNNLLTVINGYSGLVFNRLRAEDPSRKPLVEIQKAGERAANLTRQLLAVSRKQVLQPQVVSFNTLLGELLKLLQRLLGEDIELTLVPEASLGLAKVDPGQFEQAIINLAVNARDAMPQGGRLTIETHNTELAEDYAEHHQEVRAGHYVLVAVSDSGHGMDEATKARIFEPFFTTKGPGQGTGLGLAMVYGFVKQSGGHIEVYSEMGHGTTFKVYLPRAEETIPFAKPSPNLLKLPQGNETILLVEDEDAVRTLSRQVLQSNGYTVLEARDGQEAIWVAQQHQGSIHLLVTDVVMPRMSGRQLADLLAQARPYLRILFMSGYTDEAVLRHGVLEASVAFLQKPFNPIELVRKVREVLDEEKSRFR
jgi:PAS domain S-box-containing protein